MRIDPQLPVDVKLVRFRPASLRVPQPSTPSVDAAIDQVNVRGVARGAERMQQSLMEIVQAANQRIRSTQKNHALSYQVHQASGYIMVRLTNLNTGEILREYPSEKILENAAILHEIGRVKSVIG